MIKITVLKQRIKIQGNKFIYQGGKNTYKIDGLSTIEWLLKRI